MNSKTAIPADVQARLIQAATEVMIEQNFTPSSERGLELWLANNAVTVGQRAKDLQETMLVKYLAHEREIVAMISESVYHEIRAVVGETPGSTIQTTAEQLDDRYPVSCYICNAPVKPPRRKEPG